MDISVLLGLNGTAWNSSPTVRFRLFFGGSLQFCLLDDVMGGTVHDKIDQAEGSLSLLHRHSYRYRRHGRGVEPAGFRGQRNRSAHPLCACLLGFEAAL